MKSLPLDMTKYSPNGKFPPIKNPSSTQQSVKRWLLIPRGWENNGGLLFTAYRPGSVYEISVLDVARANSCHCLAKWLSAKAKE